MIWVVEKKTMYLAVSGFVLRDSTAAWKVGILCTKT